MRKRLIALASVLAIVGAACSSAGAADEVTTTTVANTTTTTAAEEMMEETIVDIAIGAGFNTLVAAVEAAGLVETLQSEGPFTVFAPTDEAFSALPEGVLDGLLADPAALAEVLTYHVVSGKVLAADVV